MADTGLVTTASSHTVPETIGRLKDLLEARGVKVFALVDHAAEAQKAGLTMNPTQVLIFGNPKAGTPLMVATPTVAIDLPMKALAWQDGDGKVWLSWNSPQYLQQRHGFPPELMKNLAAVEPLFKLAAE
ncbi:MAG TPA: DUF302 domain-containing protein [Terriglobales bacterium]|nr:DUF302 domain-containing protein [Terriglobales bacterium]